MSAINVRVPYIIALLLALAMLATLGWQAYQFRVSDSQADTTGARQFSTETTPVQRAPTIAIADVALFGTADTLNPGDSENTENLPKTNLRLSLRGVLAADGDFPGSALIEDDKGKTEVYLVGNELPGNATLRSVHVSRVILDRSGKLENLYFPEEDNRDGMSLSANQRQREEGLPAAEPAQNDASSGQTQRPETPDAAEQRRENVRHRLEELRERLRTNSD